MKEESVHYPSGTDHKFQILLSSTSNLTIYDDEVDICPAIPFCFSELDVVKAMSAGVNVGMSINHSCKL